MTERVQQVLGELVARFGSDVTEDPRRLEALLRDLIGQDRQAIFLLVAAARERVPERLTGSGGSLPPPLLVSALARDLQQGLGLAEESARWAVQSWAVALGIVSAAGPGSPTVMSTVTAPQAPAAGVIVVAALGEADYRTIGAALTAAKPGDRIMVRPGVYRESLVLVKPVEIAGDGSRDEILLVSGDEACLLIRTDNARVRGLTLRRGPGDSTYSTIEIERGSGLVVEECDISSDSRSCIAIHGSGSFAVIRRCDIHDGEESGVYVHDNARGMIEDCDIWGNTLAGVVTESGGNPTVRGCRIHDGQAGGVFALDNGRGTFTDCDIFANALAGVEVKTGSDPTMRNCRIYSSKTGGVFAQENGRGTFTDCDIYGNALAGAEIKTGADPTVRDCRLHDGKASGIFVQENGRGTIRDCEITGHVLAGVETKTGGDPAVRACRINNNGGSAIFVNEGGIGSFEDNDLSGNRLGAWDIDRNSKIREARNREY